jgi:hypothetical protein
MSEGWEINDYRELLKGCKAFVEGEPRDVMYKVATQLVRQYWGNPSEMADGLGVLLLTWNQALYRYGGFKYPRLEKCIKSQWESIEGYGKRELDSLSPADYVGVKRVFDDFLEALLVKNKMGKERRSPVAVAKAMHLLAPRFFPLWDTDISKAYGCYWYLGGSERAAVKYLEFMEKIKVNVSRLLENYASEHNCDAKTAEREILSRHPRPRPYLTLLKLIDEYNYSKHHEGWIT